MSAPPLELRQLRMLVALAETGSVSRAAQRVHLTQSAVSHQLRRLGERYGVPLLQRQGQGVRLTEAGLRLVELGKKVFAELNAVERELTQASEKAFGHLRIALECHTCFDWLMPVMDGFRVDWPEVELDLVSGFHSDPLQLLQNDRADLVILADTPRRRGIVYEPLFRFEILGVLPPDHELKKKKYLDAHDFEGRTLITYPVPEERIDLLRHVLKPAGVKPKRRTAELTIAILQLVASNRGLAALPSWGIKNYVDFDYVSARRIGSKGLWSDLFAATTRDMAKRPYMQDFIKTARDTCFATLSGLVPIN
ncbi:MAG TPA: LysR family transcriptional regulator [Burkholderiales bacterium]|nr:LysR family transcriptional regulator [Burkholderiales bacterium]